LNAAKGFHFEMLRKVFIAVFDFSELGQKTPTSKNTESNLKQSRTAKVNKHRHNA